MAALLPSLDEVRSAVGDALIRLLGTASVLVLGWLIAIALRAIVRRGVRRLQSRLPADTTRVALGTGKAGERDAGDALGTGVYWLVWLTTILLAVEALGLPALSTWLGGLASHMPKVLIAFAIAFAGIVGGRVAGAALQRVVAPMAGENAGRVGRGLQVTVVVIALLVAADQVGLDISLITTVLLAVLGSALFGAGLAFGLGARGVMRNILAMHYVTKEYRVGNVVRIDNTEGRIIRTTPTSVVIECPDGEVEIPGQHFTDRPCTRLSGDRHAA
jgi:small-conductance mechanosensitive channel